MKKIVSLTLFVGLFLGVEFEGVGFGDSQAEAKKGALEDLSSQLYVKVESKFVKNADSFGSKYASQTLIVSTNLPLIGVRVESEKVDTERYMSKAKLDSAVALPMYINTAKGLVKEILKLNDELQKQKNPSAKEQTLNQLTVLVGDYEKYRNVSNLLGDTTLAEPVISLAQIEQLKSTLAQEVDTPKMAAVHLLKSLNLKKPYFLPLTHANSDIATPFGGMMRDVLTSEAKGVMSADESKESVKGYYRVEKNFMELTLVAYDTNNGMTLSSATLRLLPDGYKDYSYEPVLSQFEKEQKAGLVSDDSTLRARLYTDKGSKELLFKGGESVSLVASFNKPAYFYIVGHVKNEKGEMSYLLNLNPDATDDERFVRKASIGTTKIGEFELEGPFGFESYQLIASTKPFDKLPATTLSNDGYDIISTSIIEGASSTRALKPKNTLKRQSAEAVLNFTTIQGN